MGRDPPSAEAGDVTALAYRNVQRCQHPVQRVNMQAGTPTGTSVAARPWLGGEAARTVIWRDGQLISAAEFAAQAECVARALPAGAEAIINLCQQRSAFLLGFAAALRAGLPTLLLPARTAAALQAVRQRWPHAVAIGEPGGTDALPSAVLNELAIGEAFAAPEGDESWPLLDGSRPALVGHTSGSTGQPQAHVKTLRALWASNAANQARLAGEVGARCNILATVPSQHMYGVEMSVLLPLLGEAAIADHQPLLPADVAAVLQRLPQPRLLVSTPLHLRALLESGLALTCEAIVSATAPMDAELARALERHTGAPLIEVYGSTETCVVATRRTAWEASWSPYPGVTLHPEPGGVRIDAPQLDAPVLLGDLVERQPDGRFRLVGRVEDLIEIAGKRASLADLTRLLLEVPGVEDAVLLQHDGIEGPGVRRLAAVVVAPTRSESELLSELRQRFDPAFLPRPLKRVDRLPRNAMGKLPRESLLALLRAR